MILPLAIGSTLAAIAREGHVLAVDQPETTVEERLRSFTILQGLGDLNGAWTVLLTGAGFEECDQIFASLAEQVRTSQDLEELKRALEHVNGFNVALDKLKGGRTSDRPWAPYAHFKIPFRPGEERPWSRLPEHQPESRPRQEVGVPWFDPDPRSHQILPIESRYMNQTTPSVRVWLRPMEVGTLRDGVAVKGLAWERSKAPIPHSLWSKDAGRVLVSRLVNDQWGDQESVYTIVSIDDVKFIQ